MLLPARTAVLKYLYNVEKADVSEIMEKLKMIMAMKGSLLKICF